MTNKMHRNLVAFVSSCALLGTLAISHVANGNGPTSNNLHNRAFSPVCLNITDNGSSVLTLQVLHRYMIEPDDRDDLFLVKALVNGSEPAMGAAFRTGRDTVTFNLNGTVAGFFSAMQINWNVHSASGTGRVLGEINVHGHVTVTEYRCP